MALIVSISYEISLSTLLKHWHRGALIERVWGTYFFNYKIIKIYPYGFNDDDNGRLICQ